MNSLTIAERLPPQAIEAGMAVLGSMMLDKEAIVKAIEIVNENVFYKDAHKKIYLAILELFDRNEPVDIITLSNELQKRGELDEVGGKLYLMQLLNVVPSSANVEYYANITRKKSILRNLIAVSNEIISSCYNEEQEADELLDKAEQLIFKLTVEKVHSDFVS
jgi:replicative DNA helicase